MALSLCAPALTIAAAAITPLLITLGLIAGAALTIVELGKITFDIGNYTKGEDPAKGKFGSGNGSVYTIGIIMEFVKSMNAQIGNGDDFDKGDRKKMKQGK